MDIDVLVIGGGMAGLVAARKTIEANISTMVIATGLGSTVLSSGTIDLLGYFNNMEVRKPIERLNEFISQHPDHPYAIVGRKRILEALQDFKEKYNSFISYDGDLEKNQTLLTPLGLFKPTFLAQSSIIRGTSENLKDSKVLVIGFRNLLNHTPALIAKSLKEIWGIDADYIKLDRNETQPVQLALLLEYHRDEIIRKLNEINLGNYDYLALPPVLGVRHTREIASEFENSFGAKVFETMSFPPSVPGLRLQQLLEQPLVQNGVEIRLGWRATEIKTTKQGCHTKILENDTKREISSKAVIIASGQIMRDEINITSEKDFQGTVIPQTFQYLKTDSELRFTSNGKSSENIFVAGSAISERNMIGLGASLTTGYASALEVIKYLKGN
ncbi:MAG: FAD-binding protein [Candidatus Jordarchaeum sp.]|uniref:FAD-binding protein n=1 Tax=Candidatus Jordarchaeum sp. TaxID=2823881 RepID=UPI00404AD34C